MVDAHVSGACVERHAGSSPVLGTKCGNSSVGRAQPCQGWGREFESRFPLSLVILVYCGNSSVGRAQPCQGWGREFESRFPLVESQLLLISLFLFVVVIYRVSPKSRLQSFL